MANTLRGSTVWQPGGKDSGSGDNMITYTHYMFRGTYAGGWGDRELDEGGQKVETSSYKISKSQGCHAQQDKYNSH